eukprot:10364794-Prorocentrum_lima.AAC.1
MTTGDQGLREECTSFLLPPPHNSMAVSVIGRRKAMTQKLNGHSMFEASWSFFAATCNATHPRRQVRGPYGGIGVEHH